MNIRTQKRFTLGQKWLSIAEPDLGLGKVVGVDGRTVSLYFDKNQEKRAYAHAQAPITRVKFSPGDEIKTQDNKTVIIKKIKEQDKSYVENAKSDSSEKFNFQLLADSNKDSISAVALIRAYRLRGHLLADLDPLEMRESEYLDELHPEFYGFKKQNYEKKIFLNGVINKKYANIKEILKFLKKTYCGNIGYEFMHVSNPV